MPAVSHHLHHDHQIYPHLCPIPSLLVSRHRIYYYQWNFYESHLQNSYDWGTLLLTRPPVPPYETKEDVGPQGEAAFLGEEVG